jgi:pyruvate/oxaloacetate carboxyltransferase
MAGGSLRRMLGRDRRETHMAPSGARTVELIDLTLRDGQQSLLATRMSGAQVMRLMPLILDTGMRTMEVWGGATLDSAMRFLDEDPFETLERMAELANRYDCSLRALSRGQNLFGYDPYPDDIVKDFNRAAVKSGVGIMRIFDALNYIPNLKAALEGTREGGGLFDGAICFTTGDPYDVEHFVRKALELESMGADMISDKDMAGLKEPLVAWEYYSELKKRLRVPVISHTHCTPGFGHISAVIAMLTGVDGIDACYLPLAGGSSHPSVELLALFAELLGLETGLDLSEKRLEPLHAEIRGVVAEVEKEFSLKVHKAVWPGRDRLMPLAERTLSQLAEGRIDEALGSVHEMESACGFPPPNEKVREAQIPGGMYSNFTSQLAKDGKSDCLGEALAAVQDIRKKAGWCPLVTPTSQIVGVKAYLEALGKHDVNPVQYVSLIAGYYGETPFPIDPHYRKLICGFSDERQYDPSGFVREVPCLEGTDLPLAVNPREKLLYYLFPDSSGKAFLEKRRRAEWERLETMRDAKAREHREQRDQELLDSSIMKVYGSEMEKLSEELADALDGGEPRWSLYYDTQRSLPEGSAETVSTEEDFFDLEGVEEIAELAGSEAAEPSGSRRRKSREEKELEEDD